MGSTRPSSSHPEPPLPPPATRPFLAIGRGEAATRPRPGGPKPGANVLVRRRHRDESIQYRALSSPEGNSMALLRSVRRWFTRDQPLDLQASNLIAEPVLRVAPEAAGPEAGVQVRTRTISTTTMVDELDRGGSRPLC